ncbi:MAG: cytochrome C [Candidatus Aminicenantes bacterium]|nr:cytochrome C [Candidatus Aminicenantes bacterium]NIM79091.1 cytochrome C [Candidatus Aminicenantes bacterium]NIN18370.1 cytochrome C [Candidatus Aminicenantes bacterium]NIN42257.1 cytochrome C [Candidatus Aminicenantes bacterium]NIN85023.1 cytochrome C [Candidatus Aminicenantes bacterium]
MKIFISLMIMCFILSTALPAQQCVDCHKKLTPGIVKDWQLSKHSKNEVGCSTCHGDKHTGDKDVAKANVPTPDVCANCHEERVEEFKKGKHALAWAAMKAMPTTHMKPMALIEGMKGCGGCHKIGLKSEEQIKELKKGGQGFGLASCDACHTRHTFSVKEARQPQACQTCHMGFDHPQWEMYSSSKHGVRYLLKQKGILPESSAAPTCQTCHMQKGNHAVRTAWGFLAVRLPLPKDKQWAADRVTILQALGVLDPEGKPTGRLEVVKAADVARLTQEDWQQERDKMINTCAQCHSRNFAKWELDKSDKMIKEGDHLLAEAIRVIVSLYKDGLLKKPANYKYNFPDLLTFHDAPTLIEQRLFTMHLKHRMRLFQGAFHANPDYALWYGWSEMVQDLTEIKALAGEIRKSKKTH